MMRLPGLLLILLIRLHFNLNTLKFALSLAGRRPTDLYKREFSLWQVMRESYYVHTLCDLLHFLSTL